jgi:hypothetical protein
LGARDSAFPAVAFIALKSLCRINAAGAACFLPRWAGTDSLYTSTGRVTTRSLVVALFAREGAITEANHRAREEVPGRARARAVDADTVRFEATIKVTGARLAVPTTNKARDLHTNIVLALEPGAAADPSSAVQPLSHAGRGVVATKPGVIDQTTWAATDSLKARVAVAA